LKVVDFDDEAYRANVVAANKGIEFCYCCYRRHRSFSVFVLRFLFNNAVSLYSLTKYSAIFAEVKGYFGITAPDNQQE